MFTSWLRDLHASMRQVWRRPRAAVTAILILAAALAAGITTFGLFSAAVLTPLPYRDPDALVLVWHRQAAAVDDPGLASVSDIRLLEDADGLEHVGGASGRWTTTVAATSGPERLSAQYVTGGTFATLGVAPLIGRALTDADDAIGAAPVALLSEDAWQRWYGRNPSMLGTLLVADGRPFEIVGVMPRGFQFLVEPRGPAAGRDEGNVDLWMATSQNPLFAAATRVRWLTPIARLSAGQRPDVVASRLAAFGERLAAEHPETRRGVSLELESLHARVTAPARRILTLVLGAVALLWLLAGSNVANLLVLQLTGRGREFAVREALGASRARLTRQLVSEALVLCLAAGTVGLAVSAALLAGIPSAIDTFVPRAGVARLTPLVVVAGLAVSLATGLLCGLVSAWAVTGRHAASTLRDGRSATSTRERHALRGSLVTAQVALAVILLVSTGLLLRALDQVVKTDPGFVSENVLVFSAGLSGGRLDEPAGREAAIRAIEEGVRALPGVTGIGVVTRLPLYSPANANITTQVFIEGRAPSPAGPEEVDFRRASTGYFAAMGIRLLAGRGFADDDARSDAVIINESMARKYWPGEDPLGKRVRYGTITRTSDPMTVVGIVGSVRHLGLDEAPRPELYRHASTSPMTSPIFAVRVTSDPLAIVPAVRTLVGEVDATIALANIDTLAAVADGSLRGRRVGAGLASAFGVVAFILAMVGLYGMVSQTVVERMPEFGIRTALGAAPGDVLRLVLRQSLWLVTAGLALGIAGAVGATRLFGALLVSVAPTDLATYTLVAVLVAVVGVLASALPARRAARVDASVALRQG